MRTTKTETHWWFTKFQPKLGAVLFPELNSICCQTLHHPKEPERSDTRSTLRRSILNGREIKREREVKGTDNPIVESNRQITKIRQGLNYKSEVLERKWRTFGVKNQVDSVVNCKSLNEVKLHSRGYPTNGQRSLGDLCIIMMTSFIQNNTRMFGVAIIVQAEIFLLPSEGEMTCIFLSSLVFSSHPRIEFHPCTL